MDRIENINAPGQTLAWLLGLTALVIFVTVYIPSNRRTQSQKKDMAKIKNEIIKLRAANLRLNNLCAELSSKEPQAIKEAIREVLHKGNNGEFVIGQ